MFDGIGKILIFFGSLLIIIGGIFILAQKVPWVGRLPGDIFIRRENFTFYFPITTSILVSIILSLIMIFFTRR